MARKDLIAMVPQRYGTRMLQAGDTLTVSGPNARALIALGRAAPVEGTVKELAADPVLAAQIEAVLPSTPADPLDQDGDGKRGGSPKGAGSTRSRGAAKRKTAAKK